MISAQAPILPDADMAGLGRRDADAAKHLIAEGLRQRPSRRLENDVETRHLFEWPVAVKIHIPSARTRFHMNVIEQQDCPTVRFGINKSPVAPCRFHGGGIAAEAAVL